MPLVPSLLAALAVFAAAQDPALSKAVGELGTLQRSLKSTGSEKSYPTERAAAIAFKAIARAEPDQLVEHCALILKDGNLFRLGKTYAGTMDSCSIPRPFPPETVADIHTHPIRAGGTDVAAAGQVFSDTDFGFAEREKIPLYLVAPAGHILRYAPGGTTCKGSSWITRQFEIVKDLSPSVADKLPIRPGVQAALFDAAGRKIPPPSYCAR